MPGVIPAWPDIAIKWISIIHLAKVYISFNCSILYGMETSMALKKIGLIILGIIIIVIAVFAVPHYISHNVPQIIEIIIVFFVLLLAFFVIWKAIREDE